MREGFVVQRSPGSNFKIQLISIIDSSSGDTLDKRQLGQCLLKGQSPDRQSGSQRWPGQRRVLDRLRAMAAQTRRIDEECYFGACHEPANRAPKIPSRCHPTSSPPLFGCATCELQARMLLPGVAANTQAAARPVWADKRLPVLAARARDASPRSREAAGVYVGLRLRVGAHFSGSAM